jgi:peroxiredoxin
MRRAHFISILLVSLTSFLLLGCAAKTARPAIDVGQQLPLARLQTLEGDWFTTEDLKGKYAAILFWATDCRGSGSVVDKFNREARLYKHNPKAAFIAISIDEKRAALEERIADQKLDAVTHAYSGNGAYDEAYVVCGLNSLPTAMVIDPSGKVLEVGKSVSLKEYLQPG